MASPRTADVSVRPAQPGDATSFGAIQVDSWRETHNDVLTAAVVDAFDPEQFARTWADAMTNRGKTARYHILAACAGPRIVGFAASQPSTDPDAAASDVEITALLVAPHAQREGHGSRLLAAVADLNQPEGATVIRTWVLDGDSAREQFLRTAGFAPDGTWRELEVLPDRVVTERRWAAAIG